jgi:hypothetical protein
MSGVLRKGFRVIHDLAHHQSDEQSKNEKGAHFGHMFSYDLMKVKIYEPVLGEEFQDIVQRGVTEKSYSVMAMLLLFIAILNLLPIFYLVRDEKGDLLLYCWPFTSLLGISLID